MLGGFGVMSVRVPCKPESEIERPVFRRICGSVSRAKMTPKIIPTSTPVDPIGSGIGSGRIDRALVAVCAVPVPAPFPDVAVHVVQPPGVRLPQADGGQPSAASGGAIQPDRLADRNSAMTFPGNAAVSRTTSTNTLLLLGASAAVLLIGLLIAALYRKRA